MLSDEESDQDETPEEGPEIEMAIKLIKEGEGYREEVYKDTVGLPTIGFGHCLLPDEIGVLNTVTLEQAEGLLAQDLAKAIKIVNTTFSEDLNSMEAPRHAVLIDLAYNLGNRLQKFPNMLAAIHNQQWEEAAEELMDSKYAKQVGSRAKRNACILRDGLFYTKATQTWY